MNKVFIGDCRDTMRKLIADGVRVQMCVTSPPYWGLRDYGTAQWEGGDGGCDHVGSEARTVSGGAGKQYTNAGSNRVYSGDCLCGARRVDKQLGLEATPDEYVANMVGVFRLVRDLLAEDGVCWINLGDCYAAGKMGRDDYGDSSSGLDGQALRISNGVKTGLKHGTPTKQRKPPAGLKPKDLCGIPWRVAFALQADGWYLRQDIIWSKPNPMPESVTDRCTKSHEYIFLFAKRERYYFDAKAIAEPYAEGSVARMAYPVNGVGGPHGEMGAKISQGGQHAMVQPSATGTRNRRSVWTVATAPYAEAHFATFPPALIEPCILAGTSQRGHCPKCGKGWERVIESSGVDRGRNLRIATNKAMAGVNEAHRLDGKNYVHARVDTGGWQPGCACGLDPVPGVVLDPFFGSGTTGQVCESLGRRWIGCELSAEYGKLADRRTAQQGLVLA